MQILTKDFFSRFVIIFPSATRMLFSLLPATPMGHTTTSKAECKSHLGFYRSEYHYTSNIYAGCFVVEVV